MATAATTSPAEDLTINTVELRLIKALTVAFETDALPYLERYTPAGKSATYLRVVYRDPETSDPVIVRYLGRYGDVNEIILVSELREKFAEYREVAREHGIEEARKVFARFLDDEFGLKVKGGGKWKKAVQKAVERLASPAPGPHTVSRQTKYRKELEEAVIKLREEVKKALRDSSSSSSASSSDLDDLAREFMKAIDARSYELTEEERERYLEKIRREVEEIEGAEEPEEPEPAEDVEEVVMEAIQEVVDEDLLQAAQAGAQSSPDSPETTEPTEAKTGTKDESKEAKEKDDETEDAGETRVTARGIVYRVIQAINEHDDIEGLDDLIEKAGVPEKHRDAVSHVLDYLVREGLVILGQRLTKTTDVRLPREEYEELVKEVAEKFDLPEGTPAREKPENGGKERSSSGIDLSWIDDDVPEASYRERRAVYRIINRFQEIGDDINPSQVAFELDMSSSLVWTVVQGLERAGFIEQTGETEEGVELYRWVGPEKVPYRLVDWVVHRFKTRHEEVL